MAASAPAMSWQPDRSTPSPVVPANSAPPTGSSTGSLGSSGFGAPRPQRMPKVGLVGASLSAGPWPAAAAAGTGSQPPQNRQTVPVQRAASGRSVTHAGKNTTGYYGNAPR